LRPAPPSAVLLASLVLSPTPTIFAEPTGSEAPRAGAPGGNPTTTPFHAVPTGETPTNEREERHPIFRFPKILRFHGGVGFAQRAKEGDGISLAVVGGVQLMLPANATQSFGLAVDYVQTDARNERRYIAPILFVENRMFGWFLMSLGVGPYISLGRSRRPTSVGISTKLGWAPDFGGVVNPFVVFRTDWVFDDRIAGALSADAGIAFYLGRE